MSATDPRAGLAWVNQGVVDRSHTLLPVTPVLSRRARNLR